jgi:hypothetical protein
MVLCITRGRVIRQHVRVLLGNDLKLHCSRSSLVCRDGNAEQVNSILSIQPVLCGVFPFELYLL